MTDFVLVVSVAAQMAFAAPLPAAPPTEATKPAVLTYPSLTACEDAVRTRPAPASGRLVCLRVEQSDQNDTN
jgi:hypothetical protein